jgi:hypothetical protein
MDDRGLGCGEEGGSLDLNLPVPLKSAMLLACKDDVVELTAEVVDPARDGAQELIESVRDRIADHQLEIMTDPAILNPDHLSVASCITSRDPLPPAMHDGLISLGFEPIGAEGAHAEESSLFARFQKSKRSRLDKWRAMYLRSRDLSDRLGELEASLIEEIPEGSLPEIHEEATRAVIAGARTFFRILVVPGLEGLAAIEEQIGRDRAAKKGRWVMHPAAVRALAAFAGDSIIAKAKDSRWSEDEDDEDAPLYIQAKGGVVVRSDPVLRVASFVTQGRKASLKDYAESVLRQSLTGSDPA